MAEFCECGSIKNFGACSNRRCPFGERKQRSWVINGVLVDFNRPVTHQEAIGQAEKLQKIFDEEFGN